MEHTPGPWRVAEPTTAIGQSEVETVNGEIIARCGYPFPFATDNKERDANASLIACAPELLQLVKDAIEDADEFETDWNKAARAAVAKVEERT